MCYVSSARRRFPCLSWLVAGDGMTISPVLFEQRLGRHRQSSHFMSWDTQRPCMHILYTDPIFFLGISCCVPE